MGHLDAGKGLRYADGMENEQAASEPVEVRETERGGRPWWQICCGGCLLLVIAAIIGGFFLFQTLAGPGIQPIGALPTNYPKDLVPPHLDQAVSMTLARGSSKSKMRQVIYAPVKLFGNMVSSGSGNSAAANSAFDALGKDIASTDTVTIGWKNLQTSQGALTAEYADLFDKAGMEHTSSTNAETHTELITALRQGASVTLQITDQPEVPGVDEVLLVVNYSNQ